MHASILDLTRLRSFQVTEDLFCSFRSNMISVRLGKTVPIVQILHDVDHSPPEQWTHVNVEGNSYLFE